MASSVQAEAPAVAEGSLSLLLDMGQGRDLRGLERGRRRILSAVRRALPGLKISGRVGQHGVARRSPEGGYCRRSMGGFVEGNLLVRNYTGENAILIRQSPSHDTWFAVGRRGFENRLVPHAAQARAAGRTKKFVVVLSRGGLGDTNSRCSEGGPSLGL